MPFGFNMWLAFAAACVWLAILAGVWFRRDWRESDRRGLSRWGIFAGVVGGLTLGSIAGAVLLLIVGLHTDARPFGGVTIPLAILATLWLIFAGVTLGGVVARLGRPSVRPDWRRVQCVVEPKQPQGSGFPYLFRYTVDGVQRDFLRTSSTPLQTLGDQWVWVDASNPTDVRDDAATPPRAGGPFVRNVAWIGPGLVVLGLTIPIVILLLVRGGGA